MPMFKLTTSSRKGPRRTCTCFVLGAVSVVLLLRSMSRGCMYDFGLHDSSSNSDGSAGSSVMPVSTAYKQSYGLFDDISDLMWQRMRRKAQTTSLYRNPSNPLEKIDDAEWWNRHNMLPHFHCPHAERIGSDAKMRSKHMNEIEGTKLVCNPDRLVHPPEKNDCLVYSVGCAGDFKFEDEIAERLGGACEIHVFDPAAAWERPGDVENRNIHYHAWGFKSTYDQESRSVVWPKGQGGGFKTFPDTLRELGHENRIIDIFKIDCEGCEWSSHKDWIGFGFRQILIELHGVPRPDGDPKARWYQKPMNVAKDYYQDFADNGYALYSRDPNGPLGLELSFIKLHPDFWKQDDTIGSGHIVKN